MDAVKLLAASPAVLDLFMRLSYRCFTAKGTESIPLFGDFGLANQIGTTDSRPRRFRRWSNNGSTAFVHSGPNARLGSARTDRRLFEISAAARSSGPPLKRPRRRREAMGNQPGTHIAFRKPRYKHVPDLVCSAVAS